MLSMALHGILDEDGGGGGGGVVGGGEAWNSSQLQLLEQGALRKVYIWKYFFSFI